MNISFAPPLPPLLPPTHARPEAAGLRRDVGALVTCEMEIGGVLEKNKLLFSRDWHTNKTTK